jgi:hypothetical protein
MQLAEIPLLRLVRRQATTRLPVEVVLNVLPHDHVDVVRAFEVSKSGRLVSYAAPRWEKTGSSFSRKRARAAVRAETGVLHRLWH